MAFKRKRIKDEKGDFITEPVTCYICKDKKAFHRMHGGAIGHYKGYGGKACCNDCYPKVKSENNALEYRESNYEMSEADWQTWGNKKW